MTALPSIPLSTQRTRPQLTGLRRALALSRDLLAVLALTGLLLALLALEVRGWTNALAWLRLALGLAFVLILPGYVLHCALFPRADDLDGLERAALSLGLSIAAVAPLALLLNALPWGLRLAPIVISLCLIMLLSGAVALRRRWQMSPNEQPFMPSAQIAATEWWAQQDRTGRLLYALLALAGLVALASAIAIAVLPKPGERMTEFYLLGPESLAEAYPREAIVDEPVSVTVGITNHEAKPMLYTVEVRTNGQAIGLSPIVELQPGATWQQPVGFTLMHPGPDQLVEFVLLTKTGGPAYRSLRLRLDVLPSSVRP